MQNNTAIVNTESKGAPLQLPEETASLIKASIAENTLKAYQRALQSLGSVYILKVLTFSSRFSIL